MCLIIPPCFPVPVTVNFIFQQRCVLLFTKDCLVHDPCSLDPRSLPLILQLCSHPLSNSPGSPPYRLSPDITILSLHTTCSLAPTLLLLYPSVRSSNSSLSPLPSVVSAEMLLPAILLDQNIPYDKFIVVSGVSIFSSCLMILLLSFLSLCFPRSFSVHLFLSSFTFFRSSFHSLVSRSGSRFILFFFSLFSSHSYTLPSLFSFFFSSFPASHHLSCFHIPSSPALPPRCLSLSPTFPSLSPPPHPHHAELSHVLR